MSCIRSVWVVCRLFTGSYCLIDYSRGILFSLFKLLTEGTVIDFINDNTKVSRSKITNDMHSCLWQFLSSPKNLFYVNLFQNLLGQHFTGCKGWSINPLSGNLAKWSNTLKQFVSKLPTNYLSVFDHFVGLALKGLTSFSFRENFAYVLNGWSLIPRYFSSKMRDTLLLNISRISQGQN